MGNCTSSDNKYIKIKNYNIDLKNQLYYVYGISEFYIYEKYLLKNNYSYKSYILICKKLEEILNENKREVDELLNLYNNYLYIEQKNKFNSKCLPTPQ